MGTSAKSKVIELRRGAVSTLTATPGWVWIVIGGVVLLIVGIVAASAVRHQRAE
jgi:hypothetical protein